MSIRSKSNVAVSMALAVFLAVACNPTTTLAPTSFPASETLHYENDVVAFDYLRRMKVFEAGDPTFQCHPSFPLGGDFVVAIGDPKFASSGSYYRCIMVYRQPMLPGSNLETIMLEAYRQAEAKVPRHKGEMDATGPVAVAGLSGFQWTYRIFWGEPAYELRDVWVPKAGELFIISISTRYTNPDDFAAFQAGADVLLGSLRIK